MKGIKSNILERAPAKPGIYLFKNKSNKIIYIGKAKNIKKRVSSYFNKSHSDQKTINLIENISSAEFIVTNNEMEALILENNFINMHKPKYNIDLKNNTKYAYIRFTSEEFPKMILAREKSKKNESNGDIYFGPIPVGFSRNQIIEILRRVFKIRNCNVLPKKVCLQYHIGQCSGPCQDLISKKDYNRDVSHGIKFLKGNKSELIEEFEKLMISYSESKNFETAKLYRDRIRALETISLDQIVHGSSKYDSDFINFYIVNNKIHICVISNNKGIIVKKSDFTFDNMDGVFEEFLLDYYSKNVIPGLICLPKEVNSFSIDLSLYEKFFEQKSAHKVIIKIPLKGEKLKLVELAKENVLLNIRGQNRVLLDLQTELKLPNYPNIIDCFDMSTIQGTNNVGACVRFVSAKPYKSGYRKFLIKSLSEHEQDDFKAMYETVYRRYSRMKTEQYAVDNIRSLEFKFPDLIVIDGGKQQLNKAVLALKELDLKIPIISLAKREEEIYFPGVEFPFNYDNSKNFMKLITRIRDEVHRFVINFHRKRRASALTKSDLNQIKGIGEITVFKLLNSFGSIEEIKKSSLKSLGEAIGESNAKKVYDYFN